MAPVLVRHLIFCVAMSMATSSSLSCMVEYTVRLPLSIHELPLSVPPVRFGMIFSEVYRLDPEHVWLRQLVAAAARGGRGAR